jgi:hypothetical protein
VKHDALAYPTDQVVGIVTDPDRLDDVLAGLREAGADDDRVSVLRDRDTDHLRPEVSDGGPVKSVVRAAQKVLGDESERLRQLDEALAAGHLVVCVPLSEPEGGDQDVRDREKATLSGAMRNHGAHEVAFYGKYQIQQLDAGATG